VQLRLRLDVRDECGLAAAEVRGVPARPAVPDQGNVDHRSEVRRSYRRWDAPVGCLRPNMPRPDQIEMELSGESDRRSAAKSPDRVSVACVARIVGGGADPAPTVDVPNGAQVASGQPAGARKPADTAAERVPRRADVGEPARPNSPYRAAWSCRVAQAVPAPT